MKLQVLKQHARKAWELVNMANCTVIQPEHFNQEVRQKFGDRRRKDTWVNAFAHFTALVLRDSCLDAFVLIEHDLNFTPDHDFYDYRYEIMDAFLSLPEGLDLIKLGLEQMYRSYQSGTMNDDKLMDATRVLALVAERTGRASQLTTAA